MIETDKLAAKAVSAERIISASPASPNEEAFERAAEADLLWYDVTERDALAESLGV